MMIDPGAVDWDRLTRFASRVTLANGGPATVVTPATSDRYWGCVGLRPDGMYEMELHRNQSPEEFAFTYAHELGHLVKHGAYRPIAARGIGLDNLNAVVEPERRGEWRDYLLKREREADEFARSLQKTFEANGMSLERWIFGGDR